MSYSREELEKAFIRLSKQERPILALFACLIGLIFCSLVTALIGPDIIFGLVTACILIPIISAGYAGFVGRLYSSSSRLMIALVTSGYYLWSGYSLQVNGGWYLFTPICFATAFIASKQKLALVEEFALIENKSTPFNHRTPSFIDKAIMPLFLVLTVPALGYYSFVLGSEICHTNIKNGNFQEIPQSCQKNYFEINAYGHKVKFDGIIIHIQGHRFGSYLEKSEEALLLQELAQKGELQYQQLWWWVLDILYRDDPQIAQFNKLEQYEQQVTKLRRELITKGHTPALQLQTQVHYLLSHRIMDDQAKQEYVLFAQEQVDNGIKGAEELLASANNIPAVADVVDLYIWQSEHLHLLAQEDLRNLMHAAQTGEYFYYISDFNDTKSRSYSYDGYITIEPNPELASALLQWLPETLPNQL
ncbi:hypothetical protein [Paraferrimonas sp. SM1919]|uniref:hypothetical protein n=1 Tax=Paraferrimonas sp. SM1919 TaxID=2662263 RepID=UPI0013D77B3B|nr:hypothetical protein [Paraferrimonas sp. SM1919]